MKAVVEQSWNVTIDSDGKYIFEINGSKKNGTLTSEEMEVLCFRISKDCDVKFGVELQDLMARHAEDMRTLEEQSGKIVALEEANLTAVGEMGKALEKATSAFSSLSLEYEQFKKEHEDVDQTMAEYRKKIKNLELDLYEAKGDIERLSGKSVHNEHSAQIVNPQ